MNVAQTKKGNSSIKLSVNPKHINQTFEPSNIRDGVVRISITELSKSFLPVDTKTENMSVLLKIYWSCIFMKTFCCVSTVLSSEFVVCFTSWISPCFYTDHNQFQLKNISKCSEISIRHWDFYYTWNYQTIQIFENSAILVIHYKLQTFFLIW